MPIPQADGNLRRPLPRSEKITKFGLNCRKFPTVTGWMGGPWAVRKQSHEQWKRRHFHKKGVEVMLVGLFSLPTQSSHPLKVFGFTFYEKWNQLYYPMKVHATYWERLC